MNILKEQWVFFLERLQFFITVVKYSAAIAFGLGPLAAAMIYFWPYSIAMTVGILVCYVMMKNSKDLSIWIAKQMDTAHRRLFDVDHGHC
jgi:hypothetical protein